MATNNYLDAIDALANGEDISGLFDAAPVQQPATSSAAPYTAARPAYVEQPNKIAALLKTPEDRNAAADRVNSDTSRTGATASIDSKGQLSLTNIGPTGAPQYPTALGGSGPGTSSIAPNTPLSVGSLFQQLATTTDVDTARGIGASLREAVAVEKVKFETQAQQFALNKLGVPRLQAQLTAAIAADQADPLYKPGMGDSPWTAKIRTDIEQSGALADNEAKRFLASNTQYAVLGATAHNADQELARITRIGDRKAAVQDTFELGRLNKLQLKEDQLTDLAKGLDATQRQRVLLLNPELAQGDPGTLDADMIRTIQLRAKDKAWKATFEAPEEALPGLAATGNQYAKSLVIAKEQANGVDPMLTETRLNNVSKYLNDKNFLVKALEEEYKGQKDSKKQVRDAIESFNVKGLTPEGKASNDAYKMALAVKLERKNTTVRFANDASSWKIADPDFQKAITQSRQVTSGAKMMDVFNAYVGDATGPALITRTQGFANLMTAEAQKGAKSVFGAPDYLALRSQLVRHSGSAIVEWLKSAGKLAVSLVPDAYADSTRISAPTAPVEWQDPMLNSDTSL